MQSNPCQFIAYKQFYSHEKDKGINTIATWTTDSGQIPPRKIATYDNALCT